MPLVPAVAGWLLRLIHGGQKLELSVEKAPNISQGSAATRLRCGGIANDAVVTDLVQ